MLPITPEMQKSIIQSSASLIARVNSRKGLLSMKDLEMITGFSYHGTTLQQMIRAPGFPAPVMLGSREKRWYSGEVFDWIDRQREAFI